MESYEFEGKTTEEAINNASQKLNIPAENLEFDIIEPGSAGIFGLVGTRKTKIRVTIIKDSDGLDEDEFDDLDQFDSVIENSAEKDEDIEEENNEYLEIAKNALENILNLIPVDTTVTGKSSKGKISLVIEGDTSGLLIGRKGKTLDALQYIVNKITNKSADQKI